METIKHKNGQEVAVSYFGNLQEKLATSTGYARGVNAYNEMMTRNDGILRPTLPEDAGHAEIVKAHNKFYGLANKYDGRGRLRV